MASDSNAMTASFSLRCECGRIIVTVETPTPRAQYLCASCGSTRKHKSRLKRIRDEARSSAIKQRLTSFLGLPLKDHESEWFDLARELKLDPVALEELAAVVQERKWQQSAAPLMFVRVSLQRRGEQWQDPFTEVGRLRHKQIFSEVPSRHEVARAKLWTKIQEKLARVTPEDIEAASQPLSLVQDEEERGVICARAMGLTRAQYLSAVGEPERRKREAAWRRLNRHGLPQELRTGLREVSGAKAMMRPGFEERQWRETQGANDEREFAKSTAVPRYDVQDDDWRTRVVNHARR